MYNFHVNTNQANGTISHMPGVDHYQLRVCLCSATVDGQYCEICKILWCGVIPFITVEDVQYSVVIPSVLWGDTMSNLEGCHG